MLQFNQPVHFAGSRRVGMRPIHFCFDYMHVSSKTFNLSCIISYLLFLFQDVIGCYNQLMEFLTDNALIVAGVILGIAALEVLKNTFLIHHSRKVQCILAHNCSHMVIFEQNKT